MRYAGWRRLKGDLDRPDLLDLGKRMLGYLENQRSLSGVQTQAMYRELPDGSVVMARWLGNLPEIMVKEGRADGQWTWVEGFAFRPTTSAQNVQTGIGGNGTAAFETANYRLQVLLTRPFESLSTELAPVWYDSNPLWWPDAPAPASFYRIAQGEGAFRYAANLDWTGDAGVLYFFGPPSRLSDAHLTFGTFVLHNGQILVDTLNAVSVDFDPSDSLVLGAALAGTKEAPVLRVSLGEKSGDTLILRIVEVGVSWANGHLVAAQDGDGFYPFTLRGSYTVTRMSNMTAGMYWNQSGNECRTIMPRYADALSEITRYAEIVATRQTDGSFTLTEVAEHAVPVEEWEREVVRTGSISLATGDIESQYGSNAFPDIGSGVPDVASDEVDTTTYADNGWFKISVDYRADVPVYLEHKRKYGVRTSTGTFSRSVVATDPGDSPSSPGDPVQLTYAADTFEGWAVGGGYVNGQAWAPTGLVETATTYAIDQDYAEHYRTDFLTLDAPDAETTSVEITQSVNATGDYFGVDTYVEDRNQVIETTTLRPMYVDLRHRLFVYQRAERVQETLRTTTVTKDYGVTGASSEFTRETVITGSASDTTTYRTIFTCAGVEVENTLTETLSTTSGGSTDTDTEADGWATWWVEPSMYSRLVASSFGPAGTQTTSSSDTEYVIPGTNWAYYSKDCSLSIFSWTIGSWVCSRNLVAYSYPIETFNGGVVVANSGDPSVLANFITGLCDTDGVPVTLDLATLLNDPGSSKLRHFPIMAISPYPVRR